MRREKIILEAVKDKDILDIGSVDELPGGYNLWDELNKVAKKVTGIDIQKTNKKGIVFGNMETHSFKKKFDVIIAGDIIEHVNNQGLFLKNVAKHLKKEGKFIVTTPNAKWWTVIFKPHIEHTLWHDQYTLRKVLNNNNFSIEKLDFYIGNARKIKLINKISFLRREMIAICKVKK